MPNWLNPNYSDMQIFLIGPISRISPGFTERQIAIATIRRSLAFGKVFFAVFTETQAFFFFPKRVAKVLPRAPLIRRLNWNHSVQL